MPKYSKEVIFELIDAKVKKLEVAIKEEEAEFKKEFTEWKKNVVKGFTEWVKTQDPFNNPDEYHTYGAGNFNPPSNRNHGYGAKTRIEELKTMRRKYELMTDDTVIISISRKGYDDLDTLF